MESQILGFVITVVFIFVFTIIRLASKSPPAPRSAEQILASIPPDQLACMKEDNAKRDAISGELLSSTCGASCLQSRLRVFTSTICQESEEVLSMMQRVGGIRRDADADWKSCIKYSTRLTPALEQAAIRYRNMLDTERALCASAFDKFMRLKLEKYSKDIPAKYEQLAYVDEFGDKVYEKFDQYLDRFIKSKVFLPSTGSRLSKEDKDIKAEFSDMAKKILYEYAETENRTLDDKRLSSNKTSPIDYERQCAKLFESFGCVTRHTPATGDQGADIIAEIDGKTIVVQCKYYSSPVGNSAVQEVIAALKYYNGTNGVVVSNATYTTSAKQLASVSGVALIHHSQIVDYVKGIT